MGVEINIIFSGGNRSATLITGAEPSVAAVISILSLFLISVSRDAFYRLPIFVHVPPGFRNYFSLPSKNMKGLARANNFWEGKDAAIKALLTLRFSVSSRRITFHLQ